MQHYIIMADVISSRTITKENDFMGQFKQLIEETNKTFASNILSPLTITLGDEFQGVVDSAETLFKLLFFLEEEIIARNYGFQMRYSMVYGAIETEINTKIAYEMYGSGLTKAREALKQLKSTGQHYAIELHSKIDEQLQLCTMLYQSIKLDWKRIEFEIITAFLKHNDYKDLVRIGLYKTRSGAWKKGKSLRIEEYNAVKKLIFLILKHG